MEQLLRRCLLVLVLFSGSLGAVLAQNREIRGRITSADNNAPVPGASVVVLGSSRGTTADAEGNYRIQANAGQTLRFSFIGSKLQDKLVGNADVINVVMVPDEGNLNEVVVTALGIKRESRQLGYAVAQVKGEDLAASQRDNYINALQGRVAGLQVATSSGMPGSSSSVLIRGVNSISSNNQPLYVIDGMPISNNTAASNSFVASKNSGTSFENRTVDFSNRAQDINPNDIETITVLKGPEAAALYGVDAANGAIIITTKKGKAGQGRITYNTAFTFQVPGPLPQTQRVYGQGNNGVTQNGSFNAFGPRYPENDTLYNNAEGFLRTGLGQRHNLAFDGGSDRYTYRFSAGYLSSQGVIPTTSLKRLNLTLGGTAKITDKFSIESTIQYINTDNVKVSKGVNSFLLGLLSWPADNDIRTYIDPITGLRRLATTASSEIENPYFDVNKNQLRDRINRVITNVGINYNFTDWLTFTGRVGLDVYSANYLIKYHPQSNRAGGVIGGSLDQATDNGRVFTGQYFLTAKKQFGQFSTSLRVGQAIYDNEGNVLATRGEKFLNPEFTSINNTDPLTQKSLSTLSQRRLVGTFGDATIGFKDLLFLTVTGRNDLSSTFPAAYRSFFYPSASLSFVFTELVPQGGFRNALSYGKFRVSLAQVGKEAPPYATTQAYESQTTTGGGFSYGFTAPNPYLKPEKVNSFETGFETKFFNGRLGVDAAYYRTTSRDQIIQNLRISYGTGFILKTINGGSLFNEGVEISLTGEPIRRPNFSWFSTVNFTKTNSQLSTLPNDLTEYYNSDTWIFNNVRNGARPGGPLTTLTGNTYLRNTRGDILISPQTGLPITETVWRVVGDRNPAFTVGFLNSIRYKNLSLSLLLDIRKGGDVYNATENYLYRTGLSLKTLDRETPRVVRGVLKDGLENTDNPTPNTIQVVPYYNSAFYGSSVSTATLSDETFIERNVNWMRVKEATLRYSLPASMLGNGRTFKTAAVFVTGTDLLLLTNYTGGDPGVNGSNSATGGSGGYGIDFGNIPLPRAFNVGINVGF
ncbi:SusC/RagA family TonB-linked outer membrane protein [Fibrella aquatilis]|uniref:SusC/RagA family TonB-linked outer membrane protein n=1 Tax=Fibrella aquatilis TaxID=2817059 RepID=A0A939GD37_9BACT|nr:SusC/RagA family TonB-linked outer membrane protein [Fibrella aquatilis]MBO0934367.1 SusC/RagA family TonB-linked outer membrane protein [Fibrella aquatilis]